MINGAGLVQEIFPDDEDVNMSDDHIVVTGPMIAVPSTWTFVNSSPSTAQQLRVIRVPPTNVSVRDPGRCGS